MSNLATLIQTKSVRKNEIRDEIGNLMSCLFTASLLVYAVRHQDIQNIDCIEALAKHLTLNVHESEIEALKEKSGFLRTIVSRSKDFDEFDRSQKGCFEKAFDSSDNDGWMVTDVSDELYDIIFCLASDLSVSHSRKLTVEGLIIDLLQSDVSKEPWASIDHPSVFTKAQVDEEILLRLVSNRYGSSSRGTVGVLIDRFDGDAFPTELFTEEQKRLIEKTQIGNYSRGSATGTCSPPDLIVQNGFASRARALSNQHPFKDFPVSELPPRLLGAQVESEPSESTEHVGRDLDWMKMDLLHAQWLMDNQPKIVPTMLPSGNAAETLAKSTAQDDKSTFKQKVRDLCEEPATEPVPKIFGKNKPMNEAIKDGLPTTLKDFMNEKDD